MYPPTPNLRYNKVTESPAIKTRPGVEIKPLSYARLGRGSMSNKRLLVGACILVLVFQLNVPLSFAQDQPLIIPEGTEMQLMLDEPLSSKLNDVGDEVYATVRRDISVDGRMVLARGTQVIGRVTFVQPARRPLKGGKLHVTFERIRVGSEEQRLSAIVKSASNFDTDTKVNTAGEGTLKEGASGGQVLQNVMTAAGIGGIGVTIAILSSVNDSPYGYGGISSGGAAAGAAILGGSVIVGVLLTKGKEIRLNEGTIVRIKLERALAIQ